MLSFALCRYDLKQGTHLLTDVPSRYGRLITALSFCRDLQEPGVQGAYRAGEARGSSAQGLARDEEEERCRGPGMMSGGIRAWTRGVWHGLGASSLSDTRRRGRMAGCLGRTCYEDDPRCASQLDRTMYSACTNRREFVRQCGRCALQVSVSPWQSEVVYVLVFPGTNDRASTFDRRLTRTTDKTPVR